MQEKNDRIRHGSQAKICPLQGLLFMPEGGIRKKLVAEVESRNEQIFFLAIGSYLSVRTLPLDVLHRLGAFFV